MNLELSSGRYVIGVSGGVDSVLLLDLLQEMPDVELIVAHVDHGIHQQSAEMAKLVKSYCQEHNLAFALTQLNLDPDASEEKARTERYKFFEAIKSKHHAKAIITAHHHDDVVETAIINMLRGTGRLGFSSLSSGSELIRPLLKYAKEEILAEAQKRQLTWIDDPTNQDEKYLRNQVRQQIIPKLHQSSQYDQLTQYINEITEANQLLKEPMSDVVQKDELKDSANLSRYFLTMIGPSAAQEILAFILKSRFDVVLNRKRLTILYHFVRTGGINKECQVHPDLKITSLSRGIAIAKKI